MSNVPKLIWIKKGDARRQIHPASDIFNKGYTEKDLKSLGYVEYVIKDLLDNERSKNEASWELLRKEKNNLIRENSQLQKRIENLMADIHKDPKGEHNDE